MTLSFASETRHFHIAETVIIIIVFVSFLVCNQLDEEERAGCLAFIVFRMSCYCKCFVALPRGAVGWSAICDSGIS